MSDNKKKQQSKQEQQVEGEGGNLYVEYAEWPKDAPSQLEEQIISIVCGNSHMHWALHLGFQERFIPAVFWNTRYDDEDDDQQDEDDDPCALLEAHIAPQARNLIFGNDLQVSGDIMSVSHAAARRKNPVISVYVISSNSDAERKVVQLFKDVPVRMFKLKNTDFFSPHQGLYPTMGVDRAATLYAAKSQYGAPVLAIDGGTAMTYTAMDENNVVMGGGISPGCRVRLESLYEHTALPLITVKRFNEIIESAVENKAPIPLFAKDTETAMVTTVLSEIACHLRNIVKQFVGSVSINRSEGIDSQTLSENNDKADSKPSPTTESPAGEGAKENDTIHVVVTGGDGELFYKLLQEDASGIVSMEPNVSPIQNNIKIHSSKNYAHYGIALRLYDLSKEKPLNDEIINKMTGLRVAELSSDEREGFIRGTVLEVHNSSSVDEFLSLIRLDHNGEQQLWPLTRLYDGLVVYNEIGEKPTLGSRSGNEDLPWVAEKKEISKHVLEELLSESTSLQKVKDEYEPFMEKRELHKYFASRKRALTSSQRKRKKVKRFAIEDPSQVIGERVAKYFPVEDPNDENKVIKRIFFGTVKYLSDKKKQWFFVKYDDEDSEEYNLNDVVEGMRIYNQVKDEELRLEGSREVLDLVDDEENMKPKSKQISTNKGLSSSIGEHKEEV